MCVCVCGRTILSLSERLFPLMETICRAVGYWAVNDAHSKPTLGSG